MMTECDESQADFSPSLMKNEWTKAEDYHCISYVYQPGDSFKPLAQIRGRGRGGRAYYYINDQLGTPQELVAADGEIVWSGIYRTYGNLAIAAGGVEQSLRFQGQYYDEESGLHYNRYRYYDPLAGRYLSQDPIGLEGGLNGYAYVPNPLTWIDPLGLNGCPGTGGASNTPPGQGYHNETYAAKPVKPEDAVNRWDNFLGPGSHTNIHPRTGLPDPDRIVSADGRRSIRYGNHEMNSKPTRHHYHEETWTFDPINNVMNVDNLVIRVPILK